MLAIHKSTVNKKFCADHCHKGQSAAYDDLRDTESQEADLNKCHPQDCDPTVIQLRNEFIHQFLLKVQFAKFCLLKAPR